MKKLDWLGKLRRIFLELIAFLFLLELALRVGGMIFLAVEEGKNKASLRQEDSIRVLCLGVSDTAIGGSDSYPRQLEKILNERGQGLKFSVINKGRFGVDSGYILEQLPGDIGKYSPQIVVLLPGQDNQESFTWLKSLKVYKLGRFIFANAPDILKNLGRKPKNIKFLSLEAQEDRAERVPITERDWVWLDLARDFKDRGDYSKARQVLGEAAKHQPDNAWVYVGLGRVYLDQKDYLSAETEFKKAIALDKNNEGAYFGLRAAIKQAKGITEAENFFRDASVRERQNAWPRIMLAWCLWDEGRSQEAEALFREAIKLNPDNDIACHSLGWLLMGRGDFASARELIDRGWKIKPRSQQQKIELVEAIGKCAIWPKDLSKEKSQASYYPLGEIRNLIAIKGILDRHGIRLVCVQSALGSIDPLKKVFVPNKDIIFVDNEVAFRQAVEKSGYSDYFLDGTIEKPGYCNARGNRIIAENIAAGILEGIFRK